MPLQQTSALEGVADDGEMLGPVAAAARVAPELDDGKEDVEVGIQCALLEQDARVRLRLGV